MSIDKYNLVRYSVYTYSGIILFYYYTIIMSLIKITLLWFLYFYYLRLYSPVWGQVIIISSGILFGSYITYTSFQWISPMDVYLEELDLEKTKLAVKSLEVLYLEKYVLRKKVLRNFRSWERVYLEKVGLEKLTLWEESWRSR